MKKLAKIVSIGLSCAVAFSLAACGDDGKKPSDTAGPDPDNIKTDQVTEAQWQAAFNFDGVTNVTFRRSIYDSDLAQLPSSILPHGAEQSKVAKFDGDKIAVTRKEYEADINNPMNMQYVDGTVYYYSDDTANYVYDYNSSTKKYDKKEVEENGYYPDMSEYIDMVSGLATSYEHYDYTESRGAYYLKEIYDNGDGQVITDEYIVKITNDKFSVYQYIQTVDLEGISSTTTVTVQAYDYGTTKVALPDGSGDDSGSGSGGKPAGSSSVTADDWARALSAKAFENVTITIYETNSENINSLYKVDRTHGRMYFMNSSPSPNGTLTSENIIAEMEDKYHSFYKLDDERWTYGAVVSESEYDNWTSNFIGIFTGLDYAKFTYDSDSGLYVAKEIYYSGETVDEIVMQFNNGNVVLLQVSLAERDQTITQKIVFSDYRTTTVELPRDLPGIGSGSGGESGGGSSEGTQPSDDITEQIVGAWVYQNYRLQITPDGGVLYIESDEFVCKSVKVGGSTIVLYLDNGYIYVGTIDLDADTITINQIDYGDGKTEDVNMVFNRK